MKRSALSVALSSLFLASPALAADRIGVLVSSFGDVDAKEEIESFVKTTLSDPDVAPLPRMARSLIVWLGWELKKKDIYSEYEAIGWRTGFRETSQRQADAIAGKLREAGFDAMGYAGFTMTFPTVETTLEKMKADGVNRVVIFYQGAQSSKPTSYIVERNARRQLEKMPDWDVKVSMVRSFSDDPRFRKLLVDGISERLDTSFGAFRRNEVCLVLPMHGNPMPLVESGDPAYGQMMRVVDHIRDAFPETPVYPGFQNHDELSPDWTLPRMSDVTTTVANDACRAVLINGRISFTVDSLETLFDHAINERSEIEAIAPHKPIVVERMFNTDDKFVGFLTDLAKEAIADQGDLVTLR